MATEPAIQENEAVEHTMPPFLRRVRIRGYKSIAFCDVPLQPLTILVGRNAAGKSNFLDALALLRDVMTVGAGEAVKRRGGWASVVSRTADPAVIEIEVEGEFVCGRPVRRIMAGQGGIPDFGSIDRLPDLEGHPFSARYLLRIEGVPHAPAVIRREVLALTDLTDNSTGGFDRQSSMPFPPDPKAKRNGGGARAGGGAEVAAWQPTWIGRSWTQVSPPRPDFCLLSVLGSQPFLELSEGLRGMGFYNFHPDAIRSYQKPNPGWLLEKDGSNLASVIEGLKEIDPESLQRVRDYLAMVAEDVESFDVVQYGENETVRFRLRPVADAKAPEFDAASMSDGTLRSLAALMAAFQIQLPFGPSVVGIEEPETALHPAAMRALVDALDDATQKTQVLLTTHSADLLSGRDVTPGQVLVVRNHGGKTNITPLDSASQEIIQKELYTLADLQRMDKLDLDEADLKRQALLSQEGEG